MNVVIKFNSKSRNFGPNWTTVHRCYSNWKHPNRLFTEPIRLLKQLYAMTAGSRKKRQHMLLKTAKLACTGGVAIRTLKIITIKNSPDSDSFTLTTDSIDIPDTFAQGKVKLTKQSLKELLLKKFFKPKYPLVRFESSKNSRGSDKTTQVVEDLRDLHMYLNDSSENSYEFSEILKELFEKSKKKQENFSKSTTEFLEKPDELYEKTYKGSENSTTEYACEEDSPEALMDFGIEMKEQRVSRLFHTLLERNKHLSFIQKEQWSLSIEESRYPYALAGSDYIIVYTGLIDKTANDNQLAFVLAHEMSHIILKHQSKKNKYRSEINAEEYYVPEVKITCQKNNILLSVCEKDEIALQAFHTQSRKGEFEADKLALFLMASACFDVRESCLFMESLDARHTQCIPTHPLPKMRQALLNQRMDLAIKFRNMCDCSKLSENDPRENIEMYDMTQEEKLQPYVPPALQKDQFESTIIFLLGPHKEGYGINITLDSTRSKLCDSALAPNA